MENKPKFDPQFLITNFSGTIREIFIFRINQMALINTKEHFDLAQVDVVNLRNKLQQAYGSAIQKAQFQKKEADGVPDIWMFGAAAYDLITEQGMRLSDVLNMSGNKLAQLAAEQGAILKAKAEIDGEKVYLFDKKSREKD